MARDYDAEYEALMKARGQSETSELTKPSEGFFLAKRQMQDALDHKLVEAQKLIEHLHKTGRYNDSAMVSLEVRFIEKLRDYVRNGMLWDTSKGP